MEVVNHILLIKLRFFQKLLLTVFLLYCISKLKLLYLCQENYIYLYITIEFFSINIYDMLPFFKTEQYPAFIKLKGLICKMKWQLIFFFFLTIVFSSLETVNNHFVPSRQGGKYNGWSRVNHFKSSNYLPVVSDICPGGLLQNKNTQPWFSRFFLVIRSNYWQLILVLIL